MMNRRAAALCAVMAGSLITQAIAAAPPLPPPYEGAYQPKGVDEIGLWQKMDENERVLTTSGLVIHDQALTAYVTGVLCDTVGVDRCGSTRVYILREPTFNATMSANGAMRVYSGLLLRVHNEAELGAVLAHEFGHFERRHSLEEFKARRSGSDIVAWASVLASLSTTYSAQRSYQNIRLQVYGDFFRFGRNQEREADLLGIAYLNRSRLRPQAAADVWRNLMEESDASALAKGLKKPDFNAIAFTASHPPDAERAAYLSALAQPDAASRDDGADQYRSALAPWLPLFLDDQIKLNDFGGSEYLIQSLARTGWSAQLWHARGELYRARGNQRDLVNASEFYASAIKMDAGLADAYRGLGLCFIKIGRHDDGIAALRTYLQLKPDASDNGMIRMMLPREVTAQ